MNIYLSNFSNRTLDLGKHAFSIARVNSRKVLDLGKSTFSIARDNSRKFLDLSKSAFSIAKAEFSSGRIKKLVSDNTKLVTIAVIFSLAMGLLYVKRKFNAAKNQKKEINKDDIIKLAQKYFENDENKDEIIKLINNAQVINKTMTITKQSADITVKIEEFCLKYKLDIEYEEIK